MVCDRMKKFASLLVLFISIGAQAREYATVRVSDIDIYCGGSVPVADFSPLLAKVSHMKLPVPESFLQLVCSKFSASDTVNVVYRKYDGDWYDLRMEIYSTKRHVSYYPDIEKNRPDALITDSNHFKGLLYDVLSKDYGACAGRVMPELGSGFVLQLIIRKNKIRRVKGIIFTQDGTPVQK